ncbi:MAG: HNH endonuclease [Acidobacteria bacterium]|nr:MAG: HNH endonuclease [Acidobacteriota bacterium]
MTDETRSFVRERAADLCEYCKIHQRYYPDSTFHIEHIVAKQHDGSDSQDNLALAYHFCNGKKGPNLSGMDPDTGELTRWFHPRNDSWHEHFRLDTNGEVVGFTAIGRTTASVLGMNSRIRVQIRREIFRLQEG